MKSAFNDIIYEKRGIYGVLHVIILLLSLFLIVVISVDTFKNIPFMTQGSYLKIQFWICMFFIADFVLEFFLSKRKLYYLQTHFIFLIVSIPYLNIISYYGIEFSPEITYFLRGGQQERYFRQKCRACNPDACHPGRKQRGGSGYRGCGPVQQGLNIQ